VQNKKMICPQCGNNQPRDLQHPRTFVCAACGHHFNYRVSAITGGYKMSAKRKSSLPDNMLKKAVGLREYPYVLKKYRRLGIMPAQIWEAGKAALDKKYDTDL
jgi:hypothetical protein